MNTDKDTDRGEMQKINVRVPKALLDEIDESWKERGYANKSEFIRDALRDAVDPSPALTEELLEQLAESRDQRKRGETVSHDEVKERLDIGE